MTAELRHLVRVRWQRGAVTSAWMDPAEASHLVQDVLNDIADCASGDGFIRFRGHDDRVVHVRGREIVAVEKIPDNPAHVPPASTPPGAGARVADDFGFPGAKITVQGGGLGSAGAPASGTEFLRQQARLHGSVNW